MFFKIPEVRIDRITKRIYNGKTYIKAKVTLLSGLESGSMMYILGDDALRLQEGEVYEINPSILKWEAEVPFEYR